MRRLAAVFIALGLLAVCPAMAADASMTCRVGPDADQDPIDARAVPNRSQWTIGQLQSRSTATDRFWFNLSLSDPGAMRDRQSRFIRAPIPRGYAVAYILYPTGFGWCGSGGCSGTYYACRTGRCDAVAYVGDGPVSFPGTWSRGYPDYYTDGDLYSFACGRYREVARVIEEPPRRRRR